MTLSNNYLPNPNPLTEENENEITVQQTTTVYEYELIDNGVLLTDTECGLRVAALNDDDGRGITNQKVVELLGNWLHDEIEK